MITKRTLIISIVLLISLIFTSCSFLRNAFPGKKDSDMDGVLDRFDKCPNSPTSVAVDKNGCPLDLDGDGIADYIDDCPDIAGFTSLKGCPDKDNDGIADKDDPCPDVAGIGRFQGCPDSDGDGVADKDDKCPNTEKGWKIDASGCPLDQDNDGIPDAIDQCPTIAGAKENKGCPLVEAIDPKYSESGDLDNDGIPNYLDKCPNDSGPKSNRGCPETAIRNPDSQIITLSKAQLGFTYRKMIYMEQTMDFRVNVVVNGSRSKVRTNIRAIEKQELEFTDLNDTSNVCYIDNIEAYKELSISLNCMPGDNDFIIAPNDTAVKDRQVLDFVNGNNWHWKIKAISKTQHQGTIILHIKPIDSKNISHPFPQKDIRINILINPPTPKPLPEPDTHWECFLKWVGDKILYVLSAFFAGFVGYIVKRVFEKKKE